MSLERTTARRAVFRAAALAALGLGLLAGPAGAQTFTIGRLSAS